MLPVFYSADQRLKLLTESYFPCLQLVLVSLVSLLVNKAAGGGGKKEGGKIKAVNWAEVWQEAYPKLKQLPTSPLILMAY